jgi:4-hydroxybenzoate polyprenyltransferase
METRWMIVIGLEIPILGFIETKNTLTKFFKGVKISRLLFYTMIPLFGILLARKLGPSLMKNIRSLTLTQYGSRAVPVEEIPVRIILTLASTASAYIFAQMINDWFDRETDRINNQKNIFNLGILPSGTIRAYGTICGIWALSSGLSMGWIPFVFIATSIAGSIIYSAKPIRLKRLPVLSSVVISLICGMLIGYGFSFLPNHHIKRLFPRNLIWIILTALPLGLQVKDLKDMAGDHATGIWTIPVLFGKRWGVYAGGFLTIAGFILTGKIMGGFVPIAAAIICSLIIFICVFRARYAWSAHAAILGFALMSGIYLWRESMEI